MTFTIYLLADPETGETRYVGRTAQPLAIRLRGHVSESRYAVHMSAKTSWIRGLLSRRLLPLILPIHVTESEDEATARERSEIQDRLAAGIELANVRMTPEDSVPSCERRRRFCRVRLPERLWFDGVSRSEEQRAKKRESTLRVWALRRELGLRGPASLPFPEDLDERGREILARHRGGPPLLNGDGPGPGESADVAKAGAA